MAGLLSALVERGLTGSGRRSHLQEVSVQALQEMLAFAARCAAMTVSRAGANPPTSAELAAGA